MASEKLPDVIELNVGGILKTTLLSTLTKDPDSTLAAMFSGRHVLSKDKEGRFFIDCDGDVFQYILDFLRFGTLPPPEKSMKVYDLAAYFNMQPFLNQMDSFHAVQYRKEIEKIKAAFGEEQYDSVKQDAVNGIRKLNISPKEDKTDNQTTDNMSDVIELNVGGIVQTTYRTTLTKDPDSKLAAMFSGRHVISKDKDGRFFIDCNGKVFQYILDFLRFGILPPPEKVLKVYHLATYYKIESFLKELDIFHAVQYRKNIEKIQCEMRKDSHKEGQYKYLKKKAIYEIEERNISPMTDKVLHFESDYMKRDDRVRYHTAEDLRRFKAREAENSTNICIKVDCPVYDDFKQLLAYELCEIGFGKYFDISTCYGDNLINCHAIVLLTH